jgi:hypothetical protein
MPVPDITYSTLERIQIKVRRITRSPSEQQLSTDELNNYINTAVLYDMPAQLRLFSLRTILTFYTQPNVDVYTTNTTDPNDPLYNFQNKYMTVHPNIYLAGVPGFFTQNRDIFYGNYPQTNTIVDTTLVGNGTIGPFTGTLTAYPILQNSLFFTALDVNGTAMIVRDYPVSNVLGALGIPGVPETIPSPYGQINYVTGQYTVNFPNATMDSATNSIYAEYIWYTAGKPLMMLYFNNQFTLRPVPDKAYAVQIQADIRPTELIAEDQIPDIAQWWQYIAYLAAKKVFDDKVDTASIEQIMPELKEQEALVNRTNLVQEANERSVTIYAVGRPMYGWWGGANWPF